MTAENSLPPAAVVPSRRRSAGKKAFKLSLLIVVICAAIWLSREALLRYAAQQWIVSDNLEPADAIVILGGGIDTRSFAAAENYKAGLARKILLAEVNPAVRVSAYDMRASLLAAAFSPKGQIAMVGDSLTELAPWSGLFPEQQIANYGIGGDTVDGVLARVPNILAWHPKKIFVMLAINSLGKGQSASSIFPKYRNLIKALGREGALVYVQSTLCTSDRELNIRVTELNAELRAACTAEPARCEFIDVIDAFCPHDQLEESSLTVDGLHLSPSGYERWKNAIAPYIEAK
jgi:lysophospholipase L1-like esterase